MIMPPTITSGPTSNGPGDKFHPHHHRAHHHHSHHDSDHSPSTPPPQSVSNITISSTTTTNSTDTTSQSQSSAVTGQGSVAISGNNMTGSANTTIDCAGCGTPILDRFYLSAVERHWHGQCLKCAQCKIDLQAERSCFARDGLIFCKADYYRLFSMRRCNRCGEGIYATELVMRVGADSVFHLGCFTCSWCAIPLSQGDLFGTRDNLVYCRTHYEMLTSSFSMTNFDSHPHPHHAHPHHQHTHHPHRTPPHHNIPASLSQASSMPTLAHMSPTTTPTGNLPSHHAHLHNQFSAHSQQHIHPLGVLAQPTAGQHHLGDHHNDTMSGDTCSSLAATPYPGPSSLYSPLTIASSAGMSPNTNHSTATPTSGQGQAPPAPSIRKGRPRKRKNPELQASLIGNEQQLLHQDSNLISGKISPSRSLDGGPLSGLAASIEATCNSQLAAGLLPGNGVGNGGGRAKRMRTSFKHHQLRTMKTYFSVNQNPDAKDLKQLAQKTGLSKRVLQVWFQNARAKWRRNNLKLLPEGSTELGHTMLGLNLGNGSSLTHPSTPSTVIGSPGGGSTRPFSSPSPNASGASPTLSTLDQHYGQHSQHLVGTQTQQSNGTMLENFVGAVRGAQDSNSLIPIDFHELY